MKRIAVIAVFFLLFLPTLATAQLIYTSDSSGKEKTTFYTNEVVYVSSHINITASATRINFFILPNASWPLGIVLPSYATINKTITTSDSGYVWPPVAIWPSPTVGGYDLIADMNNSNMFDYGDYLYNATGNGFSVVSQPSLTITKGDNSPLDHDWYADVNGNQSNPMLQVKLTAQTYESVIVDSLTLMASGTGDDKNDISYVLVCDDFNGNGNCDSGETTVGYGQYLKDDGIVVIDFGGKIVMDTNSVLNLTLIYSMKRYSESADESTYSFQLLSVDAHGKNSGNSVLVTGLPVNSAVKTAYFLSSGTTTTSNAASSTTITTQSQNEATTTTEESITTEAQPLNLGYLVTGMGIAAVVVAVVVILFYFFILRPPKNAVPPAAAPPSYPPV